MDNKPISHAIGDRIFSMDEDSSGRIWLACMHSIKSFKNGQCTDHTEQWPELKDRLNTIKISPQQLFWIGTKNNGLYVINKKNLTHITEKNGLAANNCNSIFPEGDSVTWVATDKGLSKITHTGTSPLRYQIKNYNSINGLPSDVIKQVEVKNDTVYILNDEGISFFKKNALQPNTICPPIYLTRFLANDSVLPLIQQSYLNHHFNNITLHFSGPTFQNAGNTLFKYRLVGLDTVWKFTRQNSINFSPLPYGDYTFQIYACNNDGYWSHIPASLNFVINPPFWHTWWFRITSLITLLLLIYLLVNRRIRLVEKREAEKTLLFKKAAESEKEKAEFFQKAIDMEIKFLSAQMNPHFTFNAMNSIQNFILDNDPLMANKYLSKYSRLMRLVLESNMQAFVSLDKETELLQLYMEMESMRMERPVKSELIITDAIKPEEYCIPPMMIQPYIENAFWHGLSHKSTGDGFIRLFFKTENEAIKCVIEDNGVGREKAALLKKNEKKHRSYGIFITQQRLKHLQSFSNKQIKPEITDITDEQGLVLGTRVTLYLPFQKQSSAIHFAQ